MVEDRIARAVADGLVKEVRQLGARVEELEKNERGRCADPYKTYDFGVKVGRRELARELVKRLRERRDCFRECNFCDGLTVLDVATWIESEYLS